MLIEDLEESLEDILPDGFRVKTTKNGELVIYTGLYQDEDGEYYPSIPSDEESDQDEDGIDDFESSFERLDDEDDSEDDE